MIWTLAWRNLWRQRRRTVVTCLAMAIGIAMSMAIVCMQNGFNKEMNRVLVDQKLGHIQVHHTDYPGRRSMHDVIDNATARVERLDERADIHLVTERLYGGALIGGPSRSEGGEITGVHPGREDAFTGVTDMVTEGRYLTGESVKEIVLGFDMAKKIEVVVGDTVVVVTQASDGSTGNELFTVVGLLMTGDERLDRMGGHVSLRDLQELLVLSNSVHSITLMLSDAQGLESVQESIVEEPLLESLLVRTWKEVSPQMEQMILLQAKSNILILFIVLVVAGIVVLNTMMMVVYERTREIGVLKALGMKPLGVIQLIATEAFCLTTVSVAAGVSIGGAMCWYMIQYGVKLMDGELTFSGVRFAGKIMGHLPMEQVLHTVIAAYVVALFASLWPSVRAARMLPVKAMREV